MPQTKAQATTKGVSKNLTQTTSPTTMPVDSQWPEGHSVNNLAGCRCRCRCCCRLSSNKRTPTAASLQFDALL